MSVAEERRQQEECRKNKDEEQETRTASVRCGCEACEALQLCLLTADVLIKQVVLKQVRKDARAAPLSPPFPLFLSLCLSLDQNSCLSCAGLGREGGGGQTLSLSEKTHPSPDVCPCEFPQTSTRREAFEDRVEKSYTCIMCQLQLCSLPCDARTQ